MADTQRITIVAPGSVKEFDVAPGSTVASILTQANVTVGQGMEVRVDNNRITDMQSRITSTTKQLMVAVITAGG